jgi:hypothetical protein
MLKSIAILTIALGILLLVYMIRFESEPGALPLALIFAGFGMFFVYRKRKNE